MPPSAPSACNVGTERRELVVQPLSVARVQISFVSVFDGWMDAEAVVSQQH